MAKVKIKDLSPDTKNFNKHNKFGNSLIEKSLRKFGAGRSILLDKNNNIIAGNGVAENAQSVGIEDVEIIETDGSRIIAVKRTDIDLDTPEGREMALADNSTSKANLNFDIPLIEETLPTLELKEWGLEGTQHKIEDDDYILPETVKTSILAGDVFQIGVHRLMCGDASIKEDVELLMDGKKALLVFTDPPYGVSIGAKNRMLNSFQPSGRNLTDIRDDSASPDELYKILLPAFINIRKSCRDDASYYVTSPQGGGIGMMMMMMMMMKAGLEVRHVLIWEKNSPTFSMGRLDYDYKHEPIFYTWTKKHHFYGKGDQKTSIWCIDKPRANKEHPTMKPIDLISNAILNSSQEKEIVLDFFAGSGSTMIACDKLDRVSYSMEITPEYCSVILKRIRRSNAIIKISCLNREMDIESELI